VSSCSRVQWQGWWKASGKAGGKAGRQGIKKGITSKIWISPNRLKGHSSSLPQVGSTGYPTSVPLNARNQIKKATKSTEDVKISRRERVKEEERKGAIFSTHSHGTRGARSPAAEEGGRGGASFHGPMPAPIPAVPSPDFMRDLLLRHHLQRQNRPEEPGSAQIPKRKRKNADSGEPAPSRIKSKGGMTRHR
jgi:hypothetical protein